MQARPGVAAAILAGGRASRYGGLPKGLLRRPDGQTILAGLLHELAAADVADAVVVANDPAPYAGCGYPIIPDLRPGLGPLAGVEAVLTHFAGREAVLFLPCDLPRLGHTEIVALLQAYAADGRLSVARDGAGQWHPLCAVLPVAALSAVRHALDERRLRVQPLWEELGARAVEFPDPRPFQNINRPEDWQAVSAS